MISGSDCHEKIMTFFFRGKSDGLNVNTLYQYKGLWCPFACVIRLTKIKYFSSRTIVVTCLFKLTNNDWCSVSTGVCYNSCCTCVGYVTWHEWVVSQVLYYVADKCRVQLNWFVGFPQTENCDWNFWTFRGYWANVLVSGWHAFPNNYVTNW